MRFRTATAFALALLLAAGGAARAPLRQESDTLTPDERREAGEFLLRLDESWRTTSDADGLAGRMFVGDFVDLARANPITLRFLPGEKELFAGLSHAQLRRTVVANLDVIYLAGRIHLTYEQLSKNAKPKDAATPVIGEREDAEGRESSNGDGDGEPSSGGDDESASDDDGEASMERIFSSAVVEAFKSNPQLAAVLAEEREGGDEADEVKGPEVATPEQLFEWVEMLERVAASMRVRLKELEARLPGPPPPAVPLEDEGEGELPDVRLMTLDEAWMNRPAGTRLVCGYVSNLRVDLIWEDGGYRVLAAYLED